VRFRFYESFIVPGPFGESLKSIPPQERQAQRSVKLILTDYFRLPECLIQSLPEPKLSGASGFFSAGPEIVCYGQCASGVSASFENHTLYDASRDFHVNGSGISLSFDPGQVVENLRRERYLGGLAPQRERMISKEWIRHAYYFVRELLPVPIRRHLQRAYFSDWKTRPFPAWPVDFTVERLHEKTLQLCMESAGIEKVPFIWFWPEGAPSCLIMTHDVETAEGRDFTSNLMDLDASFGIKASFQVIPEKRYEVPDEYVQEIKGRGFEFNIHDLNHDGHLYAEYPEFLSRAARINGYVRRYQARGFRAGAMYRNPDWYDAFEFSYDMSVPNVAHLEPKRGGCCTVMPFFLGNIVELPLTATQDYSLFYILNDYSIDLWKKQLGLILENNGLMSFIAHPDYLIARKCRAVYTRLLDYLRGLVETKNIWNPLPGDLDAWWRARHRMKLVQCNGNWRIEGAGAERARIAYAVLADGRLRFQVEEKTS